VAKIIIVIRKTQNKYRKTIIRLHHQSIFLLISCEEYGSPRVVFAVCFGGQRIILFEVHTIKPERSVCKLGPSCLPR
jgi:hypothetical protein